MIRPLFCGIESCNPTDIRGNHGFIKSIQKDLPKNLESQPSNLLKQKISLKHIVNKQSKNPAVGHIVSDVNNFQEIQKPRKCSPEKVKKLEFFNQQRLRPNNTIGQFGELKQNGRNLLSLKINQNQHQIIQQNFYSQNYQPHNFFQAVPKNISVKNFSQTFKRETGCIQNVMQKTLINFPVRDSFQPINSLMEGSNLGKKTMQAQKKNLLRYSDVVSNGSVIRGAKEKVKQTIDQQFHGNFQSNIVTPFKSHNIIKYNEIVPSIKFLDLKNHHNQELLQNANLTSRHMIFNSSQNFELRDFKQNFLSPRTEKKSQNQKIVNDKLRKTVSSIQPTDLFHEHVERKINQSSPFNEISMLTIQKNIKKFGIDSPKGEAMTRQNSNLSVFPVENPKLSTLTTMSNQSYHSEYQNQKCFENRFNASRFLNTNSFGIHSHLEQNHSNIPNTSSHKQIKSNENPSHVQNNILDEGIAALYQKIAKEKKAKKESKALKKRTSIEDRRLNFKNLRNQTKNQEEEFYSYEIEDENSMNRQISRNQQKKKSTGHKKNRSSFFQVIQKNKIEGNEGKVNQSQFLKTIRSDGNNCQESQGLSLFNMKNAESFVDSEGSTSEEDSELEFVVHSCSNVKLKSLALLKSMHASKHDCIKNEE